MQSWISDLPPWVPPPQGIGSLGSGHFSCTSKALILATLLSFILLSLSHLLTDPICEGQDSGYGRAWLQEQAITHNTFPQISQGRYCLGEAPSPRPRSLSGLLPQLRASAQCENSAVSGCGQPQCPRAKRILRTPMRHVGQAEGEN